MKHLFTILAFFTSFAAFAIGPITGPSTVCAGATVTLANTTPGGTWSSSDVSVATIGASSGIVTGTLTGTTAGMATISYTDGTSYATTVITVNPLPQLTSTL